MRGRPRTELSASDKKFIDLNHKGFPDDFKFENKRSSYKLIGNAVAVDMDRWIGNEAMKYFN